MGFHLESKGTRKNGDSIVNRRSTLAKFVSKWFVNGYLLKKILQGSFIN